MVLISTVLPIVSTCFSNNRILSILVSVEALKLSVCKIDLAQLIISRLLLSNSHINNTVS
ncbi:hypothetical protein BA173_04920 [Rickettsia sp. MEAM1 (Bemisia tabaci)]|uniref:hypothetical protein n=1 Tax=Rickettsia sp. wq TaxID=1851203 RepID=UPI000BAB1E28|nr:hypothetical protein [Rickettsia sp. wq]ASX28155.1 hypothetical protein BA173_04920 [Rickettsia sp. MEAM1 (Bemisia tabaci)]